MAFISFNTRVVEHRTRLVCLGETPSPRVRCQLALFTYLLTYLRARKNTGLWPRHTRASTDQLRPTSYLRSMALWVLVRFPNIPFPPTQARQPGFRLQIIHSTLCNRVFL